MIQFQIPIAFLALLIGQAAFGSSDQFSQGSSQEASTILQGGDEGSDFLEAFRRICQVNDHDSSFPGAQVKGLGDAQATNMYISLEQFHEGERQLAELREIYPELCDLQKSCVEILLYAISSTLSHLKFFEQDFEDWGHQVHRCENFTINQFDEAVENLRAIGGSYPRLLKVEQKGCIAGLLCRISHTLDHARARGARNSFCLF